MSNTIVLFVIDTLTFTLVLVKSSQTHSSELDKSISVTLSVSGGQTKVERFCAVSVSVRELKYV